MSDDAENVPENTEKTEAGGQDISDEHAEDVAQTAVIINEIETRPSKRDSLFPFSFGDDEERVDVDRTALEAILDVGARLQDIQKKSRVSMSTLALAHESYKDKQAKAKEARNNRMSGLKTQHRFLLENAAAILNRPVEYVLDGVFDADINIELLDSAVVEGGRNCVVVCDAVLPQLKMGLLFSLS